MSPLDWLAEHGGPYLFDAYLASVVLLGWWHLRRRPPLVVDYSRIDLEAALLEAADVLPDGHCQVAYLERDGVVERFIVRFWRRP